ncbi:MAG: NifB/NifX family molybdenum-iron cluster-binding protein [Thermodesulfobacteriota bacterium]
MRIAVVSNDTIKVDDWFGNASRFLIYEIEQDHPSFVTERHSEPLPEEFFDQDMMDWVADIISDCDLVFSAHIKEKPARALKRKGITHVAYQGPIEEISLGDKMHGH